MRTAPVLSGPVTVGATLRCPISGFAGDAPLSFAYTWLRLGTAIPGARSASYTTTVADAGHSFSCSVTASNAYGTAHTTSNAVTVTAKNPGSQFTGAKLASTTLTADGHGHVALTLTCPKSTPGGRCKVSITVLGGAAKKPHVLAAGYLTLAAGHSKKLRLTLTEAGHRTTRHLPANVRITLVTRDAAGKTVTRHLRGRIAAAKRR